MSNHPLDKYASDQCARGKMVAMRRLYDKAVSQAGISRAELTLLFQWIADQSQIKREELEE